MALPPGGGSAKAIKSAMERGDWTTARIEIERAERSSLANADLVLACAVHNAPVYILDLLIAKGAYCNEKNQFSDTPLTLAIWNKCPRDFIARLVEHGGDVNNRNTNGNCPITLSAETKPPVSSVLLLLQSGCDVNATNMFGDNCCTLGVWNKSPVELMQVYIKHGVDVNHGNVNGNNPLVLAGEINLDPAVVQLLIQAGADVNKPNNFGDTGLTLCAWKNSSLDLVRTYLDAGAAVNQRNINGNSVLSLASEANSSVETIQLLLDYGADVNAVNNWGDSALTLASWKNCALPLVAELLSRGANVFQLNQNQKTALVLAREAKASTKLIELLEMAEAAQLDLARLTHPRSSSSRDYSYASEPVLRLLARAKLPVEDQARYRVAMQMANLIPDHFEDDTVALKRLVLVDNKAVLRDRVGMKPHEANAVIKAATALLTARAVRAGKDDDDAFFGKLPSVDCEYYFYASSLMTAGPASSLQQRRAVHKLAQYFTLHSKHKVCCSSGGGGGDGIRGVDASAWFVVFLTKAYMDAVNFSDDEDDDDDGQEQEYADELVAEEFAYAGAKRPRRMLVVVCEPEMAQVTAWTGPLRARLQSKPRLEMFDEAAVPSVAAELARLMM